MSYQQAMRHSRNHRKDRFTQQCSGPNCEQDEPKRPEQMKTPEQMKALEVRSIERIAETTENYPIYIKPVSNGVYVTTSERDSFAMKIASLDELNDFMRDFVV